MYPPSGRTRPASDWRVSVLPEPECPNRTSRRVAQRSSYEGIEEVIEALDKAKRRLDANVNFDLTMELLMLEIKENG